VVWDNSTPTSAGPWAEPTAARSWLTVCQLPPYAHELKPVQAAWSPLKRPLANLTKRNIS
jgi:transposase